MNNEESAFDAFLKEEGIYDEVDATARKRVAEYLAVLKDPTLTKEQRDILKMHRLAVLYGGGPKPLAGMSTEAFTKALTSIEGAPEALNNAAARYRLLTPDDIKAAIE